jgi:hypothetical protein
MIGLQRAGIIPSEIKNTSAISDKTAFNLF